MIKVLIADDQELIRQSLSIVLNTKDGIEVTDTVANGQEVIASVRKNRPDVILMDIRMPKMSGLELLRKVRETNKNCFCIFVSAYTEFSYVHEAIKNGAADYILKDNPNLITIFICAPMDKCIKREMELLSFDAKKAEQHIITTDKYRAGFYKYHTGREWKNPENYDLCLNTGKFDYETCVDIIENYIKTRLAGNN